MRVGRRCFEGQERDKKRLNNEAADQESEDSSGVKICWSESLEEMFGGRVVEIIRGTTGRIGSAILSSKSVSRGGTVEFFQGEWKI